jgi:hypothetical protein
MARFARDDDEHESALQRVKRMTAKPGGKVFGDDETDSSAESDDSTP